VIRCKRCAKPISTVMRQACNRHATGGRDAPRYLLVSHSTQALNVWKTSKVNCMSLSCYIISRQQLGMLHRNAPALSAPALHSSDQCTRATGSAFVDGVFSITHRVSDYQLDQFGVVNNSVYCNYLEDCRSEAFHALGFDVHETARLGKLFPLLQEAKPCTCIVTNIGPSHVQRGQVFS